MRCISCDKIVLRPRGNTKKLQICGECRGNKGGGYSRMTNITRKDFDLYCNNCNQLIPIGIRRIDRELCKKCSKDLSNHKFYAKKKLSVFIQNQKISLIQSPYFTERREIVILS